MATKSKRMKAAVARLEAGKQYELGQAINLLKELSSVKFKESFDVSINLGVDPRKSDQVVRGATVLPRGTGKVVRVAVFADGAQAQAAIDAGADKVGLDDLAQAVKDGQIDFDVVIATPSTMRVVGQLGQILGPKGLMPNPKVGTVAQDVAAAVKNAKGGQIRYRTDKAGIIHTTIGKADFNADALMENLRALLVDLRKLKPNSAKGIYVKKITLSTTMGPGIVVDQATI